jgi:hypothetical protein
MKKSIPCILIISALIIIPSSFAGRVDLTTYYPSPSGEYKNLNSTEASYFATSSGNVGIGTTSPGAKLGVVGGNIRVEGQAVPNNFKYVSGFADWRNNSACCSTGTWYDMTGRTISYTKTRANSFLRIAYNDTLGTYGSAAYNACQWRILVGATQVLFFSGAPDMQLGTNWRMQNATHTTIVSGLGTGTYTIKVQNLRNTATECLQGWGQSGNVLIVEEVGP